LTEVPDLKVELTESGPCERTVNVLVPPAAVLSEREKVVGQFRKKAKIKGFRPGKAPRKLVESSYAESIREELLEHVVSHTFQHILEDHKLMPLDRPMVEEVDLADDMSLKYTARFEVSPKIELKKYKGIEIEKKIHKITDAEIDNTIEDIRDQQAQFAPREGKAGAGDYLLLDFRVIDEEGETSDEGRRTNQLVMAGHEDKLALFSHALVGLGEGADQKIEVPFPEDYPDETLKGRTVTYMVDVKGVREKKLPELNDEFARKTANLDSLDELRKMVRERLEEEVGRRADRDVEEQLFRKLIEENQFAAPPSLVQATIEQQLANMRQQGRNLDPAMYADAMRPAAEFSVKREYLIHEVAAAEKLEVGEEDINSRIEMFARQLGRPLDEIRQDFRGREAMSRLQTMILVDKVVDYLKENNEIKVVED
jgi:trigger factor